MKAVHKPVLLKEVLEILQVKPRGRYIDATCGEGGHATAILEKGGEILCIDQDPSILKRAKSRLNGKVSFAVGNFKDILELAKENGFIGVDGVLMDLGISFWHFEESGRGFTFQKDEPLDMRADPALSVTAADLLNGLTKNELEKLFRQLGEEKRAGKLARAIVSARAVRPFSATSELVEVIEKATGTKQKGKLHPATKVFQALRIAVNDEINSLRSVLPRAFEAIRAGGTLAVISFHSLEDRLVKDYFKDLEKSGLGEILTKKPVTPAKDEVESNPRSRSAKLRGIRKIK